MEKNIKPGLFVNDGSFMDKFKQLQQEKQKNVSLEEPLSGSKSNSRSLQRSDSLSSSTPLESKGKYVKKSGFSSSGGGKLAFSLKQKPKVAVCAAKLDADEDGVLKYTENGSNEGSAKRQKLAQPKVPESSQRRGDVVPSPPIDITMKNLVDKLACFVAKNGRQLEDVTREKNPGDTPFQFLFDVNSPTYKYYEFRLLEEEKSLQQTSDAQGKIISTPASKMSGTSQRNYSHNSNYHTPASALYETKEDIRSSTNSSVGRSPISGRSSAPSPSDPIAMMEYYMKKAAHEERKRQPRHSNDEMPPPASLQGPLKKGHHMGDYIPQEELDKFFASCNDACAQKTAQEAAERAKIQADNVGHKLLSKMGWKEGEGLGSSKSGRSDPVMAGNVKKDNLGVGAQRPGEVNPDDDIYEQYKKRMMLGYRFRPNPLNNPRKSYY